MLYGIVFDLTYKMGRSVQERFGEIEQWILKPAEAGSDIKATIEACSKTREPLR